MKKTYNINTKITAFIVLFTMAIGVHAQIDRSKQPKAGPAPEITLEVPGEFELPNGMKVLVVENHKLPRVSFSLTIDNKPTIEGKHAGVSSLLGSMLGNGTTTISKDDFNEEIDFLGATLNFGSTNAYASSLSKYSKRILELMSDAAINPLLTAEEFEKEKAKLIESLKQNEKSLDEISRRVGGALSYGVNHPYGEFTTEETINNINFSNVNAFYQKYFNPNHAYLVVIGDVDFRTIKEEITTYFGKWEQSLDVSTSLPSISPNVQYTQINFVDMPTATQSSISITNSVDLKMNDVDYHAALIANNILGGGGEGYLFKNLREKHGYTYGAFSRLGASRYASRFNATAKVRNAVTDSAVVEALKEINRIKLEPVDPQALIDAKAKYVGKFIMALENPRTIANYALNIKLNNLPEDFYTTYLQKINDVTVEDVNRVANKYFKSENARIIIVGKGSEVIANLEKTGIPIMYYDSYANATEKPVFSKPIADGVTTQTIISHYIKAIGGKENIEKIKTISTLADVTIQGAPFKPKAVIKTMAPNKSSMEMTIEGMGTIMKQKFDGTTGYQEQQGQRKPMSDKDFAEKQAEKGLFPELHMDISTLSLVSKTDIDNTEVYKLKQTKGEAVSFRYYNVETGLLVQTEKNDDLQGQSVTTVESLSNYKAVNGVLIPHSQKITSGPQTFILNTTDVKINEGVTEDDFK